MRTYRLNRNATFRGRISGLSAGLCLTRCCSNIGLNCDGEVHRTHNCEYSCSVTHNLLPPDWFLQVINKPRASGCKAGDWPRTATCHFSRVLGPFMNAERMGETRHFSDEPIPMWKTALWKAGDNRRTYHRRHRILAELRWAASAAQAR